MSDKLVGPEKRERTTHNKVLRDLKHLYRLAPSNSGTLKYMLNDIPASCLKNFRRIHARGYASMSVSEYELHKNHVFYAAP